MGVFDSLISQELKEPDFEKIYIYNHNILWEDKSPFTHTNVTSGFLVKNVVLKKDIDGFKLGYNFKLVEGDDTIYHCNYGWAFVLNTPENVEKLERIKVLHKERKEIQKQISQLFKEISL